MVQERRTMQKHRKSKVPIIIISFILVILISGFTYRYLLLPHLTVAKIQDKPDQESNINEIYLTYQLRMSQYVFQKSHNLSVEKVDEDFWKQNENGQTRQAYLNNFLLQSTKEQLIILDYAKENNIILEAEDNKKIDELVSNHSSDEEIHFITEGTKLDDKIFRKIFENLVLSEKAVQIGANKENLNSAPSDQSIKVVLTEEIIINVDSVNATDNKENIEAKKKLAEKIKEAASSGESFEALATKYQLAYKNSVKLSQHDVNSDDVNKDSVIEATKLKKDEISNVIPIYNTKKDESDIKAFVIFKCINDNISEETDKNKDEATQSKKYEQFRKSLIDKVNNTNFEINEKLFENLK